MKTFVIQNVFNSYIGSRRTHFLLSISQYIIKNYYILKEFYLINIF